MKVKAWKNSTHENPNVCYGIKLKFIDRDKLLSKGYDHILLHLNQKEKPAPINFSQSFRHGSCPELRSTYIGMWLKQQGLIPWEKGFPPILMLTHLHDNHFQLKIIRE